MSNYKNTIEQNRKDLIENFFYSLNLKEINLQKELNAIIKIQKYIRRLLCRKRFLILKSQTLQVQKNLKGYFSKSNNQKEIVNQNNNIIREFYNNQIIIIQKHWKGYIYRKKIMDYYSNKKWLEEIKKKNEETLNQMKEFTMKKKYDLNRKVEENERKKFFNIIKNLHHLISTKEIPGIYNTPYLPPELKPQVYNIDIEEHIKGVFNSSIKKHNSKKNNLNKNCRYKQMFNK